MKIHSIVVHNALENIFYILEYGDKKAIAIDPPDTLMCQGFLETHGLNLEKVFITHEHHDHYTGVEGLGCQHVYASEIASQNMPITVSRIISDQEVIFEYENIGITAIATPGHAEGHMMFEISENGKVTSILSGDALFAGGVGHTRSGSSEVLYESIQKFEQYHDDVIIYSGHDYLENNFLFIKKYFPEKTSILDEVLKRKGDSVYFTSLGEERQYNPFLFSSREKFIEIRALRNTW